VQPLPQPILVAVGGFAGAGKSVVARRLARELRAPWLCSDTIGAPIRKRLGEKVTGWDAYGAGYEVLFALAEEFLSDGCSVVADMSLGWSVQWERLDAIHATVPETAFVPLILRCPYDTCVERIQRRHLEDPGHYPPAERFMRQPQLTQVWDYLEALDRPDAHVIDASHDADTVYSAVRRRLSEHPTRPE
jgi:predicted kinase